MDGSGWIRTGVLHINSWSNYCTFSAHSPGLLLKGSAVLLENV